MDAVIAVTVQGAELAQRIKRCIPEIDVYEKRGRESKEPCFLYDSIIELMKDLFYRYDRIACIMATGIVVRAIAPHIVHKTKDPAVVVMDEKGQHVISLLSGHLGGANGWAKEIASHIDADPVITTATDVNERPAADMLAKALGLYIESLEALRRLNSDIVAGTTVHWLIDTELLQKDIYREEAEKMGILLKDWQVNAALPRPCVVITDKVIDADASVLALRPPTMVIGIGCRKGTELMRIEEAVQSSVAAIGRSFYSIAALASVDVKKEEGGLLAFAEKYHKEIIFYTVEELAAVTAALGLEESSFVKKTIGTGNVCEAAAIQKGRTTTLWQKKQKHAQVTTAISQAKLQLSELGLGMKKN